MVSDSRNMLPATLQTIPGLLATASLANPNSAAVYHQILVANDLDQAEGVINAPEKLAHLLYLKSFRTEPCQKFREHRCVYHKPYTCFNWHFPNQRRRRPFRQRNGHFNYSPDVYCDNYDENTGHCPNGDECPYLHKNAGDTERRYHMRYFRTLMCNNDRDASGKCVRNGPHCAFAHGTDDLRQPVYDIRELAEAAEYSMNLPASLEKERVLSEDPSWNDMAFVLSKYKTEPCKRSPRMCRQGYACPFYHNAKDKRRDPLQNKYRSTPCPAVKSSEEWGDPALCELADTCSYCHTRTEQQFHPEIYKSTKCNDMLHQRYCPRGPFCAFAHSDTEMNFGRDYLSVGETPTVASPDRDAPSSGSSAKRSAGGGAAGGGGGGGGVTGIPPRMSTPVAISSSWGAPGSMRRTPSPLVGMGLAGIHGSMLQQLNPQQLTELVGCTSKGRTLSGGSCNSVESGLGSLLRGDTPPRFRRTPPPASHLGLGASASPAPQEDDLDLEDIMQRFGFSGVEPLAEEESEDSAADLEPPVFRRANREHGNGHSNGGSMPIGIPGAVGEQMVGSPGSSLGSSLPFAPAASSQGWSAAVGSGRSSTPGQRADTVSPGSCGFPQSPILSQTAFSNAAADLDRLASTPDHVIAAEWPEAAHHQHHLGYQADPVQMAQAELLQLAAAAHSPLSPLTVQVEGAGAGACSSSAATPVPNLDQLSPEQVTAMKNQLLACMQVLNLIQPDGDEATPPAPTCE